MIHRIAPSSSPRRQASNAAGRRLAHRLVPPLAAPLAGLAGLAAVLLLAGCGAGASSGAGASGSASGTGSDAAGSPATAGSASATSTDPGQVDLVITISTGSGSIDERWTLTCSPVGGTHPQAAAACAALAGAGENVFAAPRAGQMCTQIYGGAQTATVTGTWRGEKVSASFARRDGCQIARWDALVPLLPRAGAARGASVR